MQILLYLKLFVYYTPIHFIVNFNFTCSLFLVLYFLLLLFMYFILFFFNFTSFSFLSTSKHFGSIYTCFVTLCRSVFVFHYQFVSPLVTVPCAVVVFVLSVYALCVFMCVCVCICVSIDVDSMRVCVYF